MTENPKHKEFEKELTELLNKHKLVIAAHAFIQDGKIMAQVIVSDVPETKEEAK